MKCRDSGNECLTVKCDLFRAGRLLRKKNGESFQEPWYFEVQKIGPETRNGVLKRLKRLSCKTVTGVSPKFLAEFLGNLVSRKFERSKLNNQDDCPSCNKQNRLNPKKFFPLKHALDSSRYRNHCCDVVILRCSRKSEEV